MTPVELLRELIKVDEKTARILLAGLGLVAAAAIVQAWALNLDTALLTGAYIAGSGALLYIGAQIISDPINRLIIGRSLSVLVVIVAVLLLVTAACPGCTLLPPLPCLVRPWEQCRTVIAQLPNNAAGDAIAEVYADRTGSPTTANPPRPPAGPQAPVTAQTGPPSTAPSSAVPSSIKVVIQFAGALRREDVVDFSNALLGRGWKVQGASRGGERTPKAAGVNEVRYSDPGAEASAAELAQQVSASGLAGRPVRPVRTAGIAADTLEVWMSR